MLTKVRQKTKIQKNETGPEMLNLRPQNLGSRGSGHLRPPDPQCVGVF